MLLRHGRIARRMLGQALVPVPARALPAIYLARPEKPAPPAAALPAVYLCEPGTEGASCRLKWLASTCLAGMVGLCLIGLAIYASSNLSSNGGSMVSSIRRASLAALQPIRTAAIAHDGQAPTGEKGDLIQVTSAGFATRHIIHDTVVERQGSREFTTIKPYAHIIAGLASTQPDDASQLPPFNPFKLYSDTTPIANGTGGDNDTSQFLSINVEDMANGQIPDDDGIELKPDDVGQLVAEAADNFADAETTAALAQGSQASQGSDGASLQSASYHPGQGLNPAPLAPNTTIIYKTPDDADDGDDNDVAADLEDGSDTKTISVGHGDTLLSIMTRLGVEPVRSRAVIDALAPAFQAGDLKSGMQVEVALVPAPSDTGAMEPLKVSILGKGGEHVATIARAKSGDFVAVDQASDQDAAAAQAQQSQRATLYTSFYHAALSEHLPPETILKLLRVHSYDVDFKQKVHPGDSFEAFLDIPDGEDERDGAGEVLYTSMTVDGQTRSFYRFRTPDGTVDYYDAEGNSAKKFLMRDPVRGGRYSSGFGLRRHPLLGVMRMHTGVDWAAPVGTPILAAGDGIVEMVGREGGYGNYVRIRHPNGFATAYGHMSRFADGLQPGVSVHQGQVIGYVGSTGMSTGPHCHYEILVNNKFVNPMTIQVPRGLQLQGKELAEFEKERKRIEALMQLDPVTNRVAEAQ